MPGLLGDATVTASAAWWCRLNSLADAADEIATGPNLTGNYASVNFADPENNGGGGHFGGDVPFPSDTAADDNDFAVEVEATLEILLAGTVSLWIPRR